MKNILFIIPSLGGGGAEKVLIDIFNRFDYSHYRVDLLVVHYFGPYINQVNLNVHVEHLFKGEQNLCQRIVHRILRISGLFDIYNRSIIRKKVKKDYDTIISFTTNEALYYHSFIFDHAKKNINWVHVDVLKNHNSFPFKSKASETDAYKHIDQLVFVSADAQKAFNIVFKDLDILQDVIYNIIDKKAIEKKAEAETITKFKPTIVAIGRLVPIKGYDRIIQVAKMLKADNYEFQCQIIGIGYLYNKLQNLIKEEGLEDVVTLLGFKSNPYPYLKAADIFISTSLSEAFPLVVCESLCLGKAIVCTKTTGPIEILQNKYGILTEHDVNDIYKQVKRLFDDPQALNRYKNLALERSEMFKPENTMKQIYNVI